MLSDRPYMHGQGYYTFRSGRRESSIIVPLILANVAVFLLTGFGRNDGLIDLLKLHPYYIREWQVWRLGTYMFVHGDEIHIFFNMWMLYVFGRLVEERLGARRFLQLYLTSGAVGGITWLLFNWGAPVFIEGRAVRALGGVIGASGSLFGVMMAAAMMFPREQVLLPVIFFVLGGLQMLLPGLGAMLSTVATVLLVVALLFGNQSVFRLLLPVRMSLRTSVAVYAGAEVLMELAGAEGRIAHLAHLGGLAGAFLYMRWYLGAGRPALSWRERLAAWRWQVRALFRGRRFRMVPPDAAGADPDGRGQSAAGTEVDRILDKIGRHGLDSLTSEERQVLSEARDHLRKNRQ